VLVIDGVELHQLDKLQQVRKFESQHAFVLQRLEIVGAAELTAQVVDGHAEIRHRGLYRPETPRKGILGFPTTRGDRFFVSLLGSAFIFILWIRLGGGELWYALAICIPFAVAMFRFA